MSRTGEIARVIGLPVDPRSPDSPLEEIVEEYTERLRRPGGRWRLFPTQALALACIEEQRGLLGSIMVGGGKTLIAALAPTLLRIQPYKTVLFTRSKLIQPYMRETAVYADHFRVAGHVHVMSYDRLSSPKDGPKILEEIAPDLVIADEAHCLKSPDSARTRRFMRYFADHPETILVAMSGTMTQTSILDYAHLAEIALGDRSPLPRSYTALQQWAACLDARKRGTPPPEVWQWQSVQPLVDHFGAHKPRKIEDVTPLEDRYEITRSAFFERLSTAPGTVHTRKGSIGTALELEALKAPSVPEPVKHALRTLRREYVLPGGEELTTPLEKAAAERQLLQGLYYRWDWPDGEVDEEWMEARRNYARQIRRVLHERHRGLDSPSLIAAAVERGEMDADTDLLDAWAQWLLVSDRPQPPTVPVWISDYLVKDAVKRATAAPMIVWYEHRHVAAKLAARGLRVVWAESNVNPETLRPEDGSICLSVDAHTDGLNLQYHWHRNLLLCPPTQAGTWEQLLGRTHRRGQEADLVTAQYYAHETAYRAAMEYALQRARYVETNHGQSQKILIADKIDA